jgi:hypothetical protein
MHGSSSDFGEGFIGNSLKTLLNMSLMTKNIPYEREKKYAVEYKGIILPHYFFADRVTLNFGENSLVTKRVIL